MRRKTIIGDVFEVPTSAGLAYFQLTVLKSNGLQLIRVLPGFFSVRPGEIRSLVNEKETYFTFYGLGSALSAKKIALVSNEQVPERAKSVILRHSMGWDPTGRTNPWILLTPDQALTTDFLEKADRYALTAEIEKLSMDTIWPHETLVNHLVEGWRPELNAEFMEKQIEEGRRLRAKFPKQDGRGEWIRHNLRFRIKARAQDAKEFLSDRGFAAEVQKPSGETKAWLTIAFGTCPPEAAETLRDGMETLAEMLHGRYAGSEIGASPDPTKIRMGKLKSLTKVNRTRVQ
jgi:hypothetical protein